MTPLDSYKRLARYYQALIGGRTHFDGQHRLVLNLLEANFSDRLKCRVLDAACGTGDVLALLRGSGLQDLAGTDGSTEMLSAAKASHVLPDTQLTHCLWSDLGAYFGEHGQFDLIYILGNSIAHCDIHLLPIILENVFLGLNTDGLFCFDIRNWKKDSDGHLRQVGRESPRWLCNIEADGTSYSVSDECSYSDGRQYITYHFEDQGKDPNNFELAVSYAIFDPDEALALLRSAGFQDLVVHQNADWSYVPISGRRRG